MLSNTCLHQLMFNCQAMGAMTLRLLLRHLPLKLDMTSPLHIAINNSDSDFEMTEPSVSIRCIH